jgi:hypothetical protein
LVNGLDPWARLQVGMFQVLLMGRSAEEAYRVVAPLQPCPPFRDASCGISTFHLTVQHCIHVSHQSLTLQQLQPACYVVRSTRHRSCPDLSGATPPPPSPPQLGPMLVQPALWRPASSLTLSRCPLMDAGHRTCT